MQVLVTKTQGQVHTGQFAFLSTGASDVGITILALFPTMRALRSGPAFRLDHCERLVGVGAGGDSMATNTPLTGVLDAVDKNHGGLSERETLGLLSRDRSC